MNTKEFHARANNWWRTNHGDHYPTSFVYWILDTLDTLDRLAKEQSTWEKIVAAYTDLKSLTGVKYVIKTCDGEHALEHRYNREWVPDLCYDNEDEFLKRLTALVDEHREVTFTKAYAAFLRLTRENDPEAGKTLNRYFEQRNKEHDKDKPHKD